MFSVIYRNEVMYSLTDKQQYALSSRLLWRKLRHSKYYDFKKSFAMAAIRMQTYYK